MKKFNFLKAILFLCVLTAPLSGLAFDLEIDGIYYNITSSSDLTAEVIYGTNKYNGEISIPPIIEFRGKTLSVTKIGANAFSDCKDLISVTLSEGITTIGSNAFDGCINLENLSLPNTLKRIDDWYAFGNCKKLSVLPLKEGVEYIGGYAFFGCDGLTEVKIPNSVTKTGHSIFGNCTNLIDVYIPKSITQLNEMLWECNNLKYIRIESPLPLEVKDKYYFFNQEVLLNATLYVPNNASNKYKESLYWKDFFVIEEDESLGTCYYMNFSCDRNGSIEVLGKSITNTETPITLGGFEGDNINVVMVPNKNYSGKKYHVKSFIINEEEKVGDLINNSYEFVLMNDFNISVEFIRYYDVTIGTIGEEGTVYVNNTELHNNTKTFMIDEFTPTTMNLKIDEGYYAKGEQKGYFSAFKQLDDSTFILEQPIDFEVTFKYNLIHIQLYSTCIGEGVFYTNGNPVDSRYGYLNTGCYYWDTVNLKFEPKPGYHLASLIIDGNEVIDNVHDNEYSFIAKAREEIKMICEFKEGENMGLIDTEVPQGYIDCFNISGVRLSEPSRGINIIRCKDGKFKKIIVK